MSSSNRRAERPGAVEASERSERSLARVASKPNSCHLRTKQAYILFEMNYSERRVLRPGVQETEVMTTFSRLCGASLMAALLLLGAPDFVGAQSQAASPLGEELKSIRGPQGGIGGKLDITGGKLILTSVVPGGPAAKAGLQPGWEVVTIDGVATASLPVADAVKKMRGPIGSTVKLEVKAASGERKQFSLVRDRLTPAPKSGEQAESVNPTTPFSGRISRALRMARSRHVYVVPTHESDAATQEQIKEYVLSIRDRFAPDAPVVTDEDALKHDLSSRIVIVYGTLTGNLWLAQMSNLPPVRIEADQITADRVFAGSQLRLISAFPNPGNPAYAVVIYTAQRAEDVVNINDVFHGPTDYVVAKGTNIVQAANYDKSGGKWTFPTPPKPPAAERLKQLKSLHEQGLIPKEEYDKKVKEIMDSL